MRWWGWGEDGHAVALPPAAETLLRAELGADPAPRAARVAGEVSLPDSRLPAPARERLVAAVGSRARAGRARGPDRRTRSGARIPDLVRIRSGDASSAPDAVVLPASAEQVAAVLAACAEHGVAVVPFGGGTSVVGGVEPRADGMTRAVSLDLGRLRPLSRWTAPRSPPGSTRACSGPRRSGGCRAQGVTLGPLPAVVRVLHGGRLGRHPLGRPGVDRLRAHRRARARRALRDAGRRARNDARCRRRPRGRALRELVVGSEGVLGVICEATLRVRPAPAARRYEGWSFASFAEGCDAFRVMEQAEASADVNRLSDEAETRLSMAIGASGSTRREARAPLLRAARPRGRLPRDPRVRGRRRRTSRTGGGARRALLRAGGGVALGQRPGEAWLQEPLRRALPARRAARPRRARRDARDRHRAGRTSRDAPRTRWRGAPRRRSPGAGRRRS